jgi:hypothetical protein
MKGGNQMDQNIFMNSTKQKVIQIALIVGMAIFIFTPLLHGYTHAAEVKIYGESNYTVSKLMVNIFVDCTGRNVLSFGVKLTYNSAELSVVSAEKNEAVWYFGNESQKFPYKDPDVSKKGEVSIIGGRLDTNNPLGGVRGERILIGKVLFNRISTSISDLSLSFAKTDNYVNFMTTDGTVLDTEIDGVSFGEVMLQYNEPPVVTASPPGGTYDFHPMVTLSVNKAADIYYTLDGTIPTLTSSLYISPIKISEATTLKSMAVDEMGVQSQIVTETYIIRKDISVEMQLPTGWSMISLPLITSSKALSDIFPEAVVAYGYEKSVGYKRLEELEPGNGYWLLVDKDQSYTLTGQPFEMYSYTVDEDGWQMIGGCTYEAQPFTYNCDIGVIYGYEQGKGYQRILETESLMPGSGYWALFKGLIDLCELKVEAAGP